MLPLDALIALISVVDEGSFSAAATRLGQTPSGVSRAVSRLEAQLGVRLITRTTRRLELTEEGAQLLARARRVVAELSDIEEEIAASRSQPAGLVRVNAASPVLNHLVAPLVAEFRDRYPLVRLELVAGETVVDLIEEGADLAIRIGPLADSTLNARRLGDNPLQLLASPGYLARHGAPADVAALARHTLLGFTEPASLNVWPLADGPAQGVAITPTLAAASGETLRQLALNDAGIACLARFLIRDDVASGRLAPVLAGATLDWRQPVWAVFYKRDRVAPRVTAFVDFLAEKLPARL